jgi:soluble lytic murein transglycosylase-like protein
VSTFLIASVFLIALLQSPLAALAGPTGRLNPANDISPRSAAGVLQTINPRLGPSRSLDYAKALVHEAHETKVDPTLVMAVVTVESRWDYRAISEDGARGLGQLMPDTARELGVRNVESPRQNLQGTTHYLARLLGFFHHDRQPVQSAIAAYTLGPTPVEEAGGVPQASRGPNYVARVLHAWEALKARFSRHPKNTMPVF